LLVFPAEFGDADRTHLRQSFALLLRPSGRRLRSIDDVVFVSFHPPVTTARTIQAKGKMLDAREAAGIIPFDKMVQPSTPHAINLVKSTPADPLKMSLQVKSRLVILRFPAENR